MDPSLARLPGLLGSLAALVVTLVGFLSKVAPLTALMRAAVAFMVFGAIGLVFRYVLSDALRIRKEHADSTANDDDMGEIPPGSLVDDVLNDEQRRGS